MKTRILRTVTGGLVAVLLLGNAARSFAAPPPNPPPPGPPPPAEPPPEPKPKRLFVFPGGNPFEFIAAMDRHFRTRLNEILSIPHALAHAQVPKMRLITENPVEPLSVYNRLGDPLLGRWVWEGYIDEGHQGTNVNVLALVPDKTIAGTLPKSSARVKALALAGVPKSKWQALQEDIAAARKFASPQGDSQSGAVPQGEIRIQPSSKVLIVSGSDDFIEMVESVVAAHRANAELEAGKFSKSEEKPSEK